MPGAETARKLAGNARMGSTRRAYDSHFAAFAEYCEAAGVSALPASRWTVFNYVGYLAEGGRWAADSLQPIFSAINAAHKDYEFEPPASDNYFLSQARTGLRRMAKRHRVGLLRYMLDFDSGMALPANVDKMAASTADVYLVRAAAPHAPVTKARPRLVPYVPQARTMCATVLLMPYFAANCKILNFWAWVRTRPLQRALSHARPVAGPAPRTKVNIHTTHNQMMARASPGAATMPKDSTGWVDMSHAQARKNLWRILTTFKRPFTHSAA